MSSRTVDGVQQPSKGTTSTRSAQFGLSRFNAKSGDEHSDDFTLLSESEAVADLGCDETPLPVIPALHEFNMILRTSKNKSKDTRKPTRQHRVRSGEQTTCAEPGGGSVAGHLFVDCIRCLRMVEIQFHDQKIPVMSKQLDSEYVNGIVLTICKSCKTTRRESGSKRPIEAVDYTDAFKKLRMNPQLFEGSDFVKAARQIVGEEVAMLTLENRAYFEDISRFNEKISREDSSRGVEFGRNMAGELTANQSNGLPGSFL